MTSLVERLRKRHKTLDRLIDTSRSPTKQEDIKVLKRRRLLLRDRIARLQRHYPA